VIARLSPSGGITSLLNCRQQDRHKDRDNRDHHQQLNQREATSPEFFATPVVGWATSKTGGGSHAEDDLDSDSSRFPRNEKKLRVMQCGEPDDKNPAGECAGQTSH
jgi:hypothetical protein